MGGFKPPFKYVVKIGCDMDSYSLHVLNKLHSELRTLYIELSHRKCDFSRTQVLVYRALKRVERARDALKQQ